MRPANYEGIDNKCKRLDGVGIAEDEESMWWDKGFLGCHNAKVLMNTIYFYNSKFFGLDLKSTGISGTVILELIRPLQALMRALQKRMTED